MSWSRLDDKFHENDKANDAPAASLGLWVLAKSWCSDNAKTEGFIPTRVIMRWHDPDEYDVNEHAANLVRVGLWHHVERKGRQGYVFNDWDDYQQNPSAQSFSAHVRWHVNKGIVSPDCDHCPKEPEVAEEPDPCVADASHMRASCDAMPYPNPNPNPLPKPNAVVTVGQIATLEEPATPVKPEIPVADLFDEFWAAYPRKVGKPKARNAWKSARRKAEQEEIVKAAIRYRDDPNRDEAFTAHPQTWLNRDGWNDPPLPSRGGNKPDRIQQGIAVVQRLQAQESLMPSPRGELA